ncbi:DUF6461 domain-containing protein [Nonomuraea sediminis]|uniref:DUF6461 domain-containing protein n=1 Tax=Nonomuraea sediminis TaxID=2835864 RepID=UPI001BDD8768|nr:DUF6461 domain-containing protein [Nonomuraea sediminis]
MTPENYAWFDGHDEALAMAFCIAFVRGLTPAEAFARLDITPEEEAEVEDLLDEGAITASAVEGGTILVEPNGFAGTLDTVAKRLSPGTVMASVFLNVNADQQFVYAADGQVVTQFEPDYPDARSGADENRLLPSMIELGMPTENADTEEDWGDPILIALALAERVTGVRLTPQAIDEPELIGSTAHLT